MRIRNGISLGLLATTIMCGAPMAFATITTAPLDWRVMSLEAGLDRVKDQFLGRSIEEDKEFVGAVLQNAAGAFSFTHGHGQPGQDQVTFRIQRPESAELVGLWHTHGADGPTRTVFSPTDAELVRRTGLPFYLITPDGEIRVLRPEHVSERRAASRLRGALARLPRGSHPGERLRSKAVSTHPSAARLPQTRLSQTRPPRGCADVIEV